MTGAFPIYFATGTGYAHSEESRAMWQSLVDKQMEQFRATFARRARPVLQKPKAVCDFLNNNMFAHGG